MPDCPGPATVVFDPSLTEYDFGAGHPMSPVRVDLTMRLAGELGVLDRGLKLVDAPMADDDLIATVHDRGLIEAVNRAGTTPGAVDEERGLGTDDNPVFKGMHDRRRARGRRDRRGRPPGVERREPPLGEHHRRPAPRDARPGRRLLHLQRRRGRHPVPPRPGRGAGGVRRRRRPPRRRGREDLLGRPARADDQPARDRADAVPGHRLPQRHRRPERAGERGQRGAPAGHRRRGLAAGLPRGRPAAAARVPTRTCWSPSTAATPTSRTRSPT